MLHSLISGLLDLVSPPTCAACRSPLVARAAGFCRACKPLLEPAPVRAGARDLDACLYGGPLRDALHRLKYEGASELAPVLAEPACEAARALFGKVDCAAIVPLHARKLRERGYNQAALLARPVARMLGVPLWPRLLSRVRDSDAQVGKGSTERAAQLAHAFAASARASRRAVLVIDDVRTTGATLLEARRALLAAGAREVFTLALARAPANDERELGRAEP